MTDLTRDQRRALENAIKAARDEAEAAAADALRKLGVAEAEAPTHLDAEKRKQRNRLRAHARALGDARATNGAQAITRLTEQAAYVQWHRLLFARFLIERKLLREETGATVSLNDCREIAFGEGAGADEWSVAAGFAAAMLPGVFPADDPAESLVLAPEHARTLRQRLLGIHPAIFLADDSLGWTYQFWRAAEKKAVNEAQVKIGAAELPAVTQLFTEPYMVRFLLHNTLGAWWAGKRLAAEPTLARKAADEAALRTNCALPGYTWEYLRFVREDGTWRPAAGTFPGWPTEAIALSVLDPCCGSGHFLTEALAVLTALRRAEEGLSAGEAVTAVLRDNLAGLEIDGRCVQIAAFNLALTGWLIGGPGTTLPTPNVAWVGAPPPLPKAEFAALANGDAELRRGLEALHDLFHQAPLIGSLIEPVGGDLADPRRVARIEDSIAALVERIRGAEPERAEGVVAALGMADAAALLVKDWNIVATNVPFVGSSSQSQEMINFFGKYYPDSEMNLATVFLERILKLLIAGGVAACVLPSGWTFQRGAAALRSKIALTNRVAGIFALGDGAFESASAGEAVSLCILENKGTANKTKKVAYVSVEGTKNPADKARGIINSEIILFLPNYSERNFVYRYVKQSTSSPISALANSYQGLKTGDIQRFTGKFWEFPDLRDTWQPLRDAVSDDYFSGLETVVRWEQGCGSLHRYATESRDTLHDMHESGQRAWGKVGVLLNAMGDLKAAPYYGEKFLSNVSVIIPNDPRLASAIFAMCSAPSFVDEVRAFDPSRKVTNGSLVRVPFDAAHWTREAGLASPGFAEPYSDDPNQWLFHGHPRYAEPGTELQVALARLAGYRWPAEVDTSIRLSTQARAHIAEAATLPSADADGLLPLAPLLGERGLADRLRAWCVAAWGKAWTAETESALITAACARASDRPPRSLTLDAWLRTHAARQHAKLFHDRPFLWWITDGRADGFTAVIHYHRLTRDALSRLAFHVLGDHLARLGDDPRAEAARILQKKLEQIIEGEAPYDIFVRWKHLHDQPLGWDPDQDDGVRLNIRPFIEAEVLAHVPNVKYGVDRGKDVPSAPWYGMFNGERRNDHHTTLAEKRSARANQESQR